MIIKLRPHHLLCTQGFSGKGYSDDFARNMTATTTHLRHDSAAEIEIVFTTDDICKCCPRMVRDGICANDDKVKRIDGKVTAYFGVPEGRYVYSDIIREVRRGMTRDMLEDICGECEWYAYGDCTRGILGGE